jgi:molybdate transport system permease protein
MILTDQDWSALWLTLKLAFVTVLILLLLGTPFAWWLARTKFRFKFILEALVALPLVLPPTVLGFYLLMMLNPNGTVGKLLNFLGIDSPVFSFSGLVMGSVVYSMPFVVQPLYNAFLDLGNRPLEVAASLGAAKLDQFVSVVLPLCKPAFITAAVLGFAHTLGEFGVVLMLGGNIPGQTQVVSIAIYDHVEALEYPQAHSLSLILLGLSFAMLLMVFSLKKSKFKLERGLAK